MDYQYKNGVFIYYLPKELDHYYADNVTPTIDKLLKLSGIYTIIKKKDTKEDIIKEMVKGGYYE